MAEVGTVVQGEDLSGSSQSPQVTQDKAEERARAKGWKPLEEFKGDEADWVPAKEFLGREKLFDKIHDLKNQLTRQAQQFQKDMGQVQQHFAEMREVEFTRAKAALQAELKQAKAEGEVDRVEELAGQIQEVDQQVKQAKQQAKQAARPSGPTPEFEAWQGENKWFNSDAEMTADAIAIGTGFAAANPNKSQKEVLEYTATKIRRMYPEKFESDTTQSNGKGKVADNRVEGGGNARPVQRTKGKLTVADLSDMERSVMTTLIKRNALKDVAKKNNRTQQEEYLAQLAERRGAGE